MTHRVVIIGSGFGGLFSAKALKHSDVEITLIARTNAHLFQPLLYQVATGLLSSGEIAPPIREVLRRQENVEIALGLVTDVDVANKVVQWRFHDDVHETPYDTLIVAAGAGQSYFGNDRFAKFAPGLKTIDDALEQRARILKAFEIAETATSPEQRRDMLTFVVVGAGPTGVEMAGQIRELATSTLKKEYRNYDPADARVILVDGAPQVLPAFGPELGRKTQRQLEKMGVEVRLDSLVTDIDAHSVEIRDKQGNTERIRCFAKVWAAGVQGSELGETLAEQTGAELNRAGQVVVQPDLTLPGHPEVFVIGDMMAFEGVPGVAQGAIQSAQHTAATIKARLQSLPEPGPFSYRDKGSMATISKFSAVVMVGKIRLTGFIAWLAWLFLHLLYIAGFKQRITTLVSWFLAFVTNGRSQRVVTNQQMVGRLAMEFMGPGSSARLMRDEQPTGANPPVSAEEDSLPLPSDGDSPLPADDGSSAPE